MNKCHKEKNCFFFLFILFFLITKRELNLNNNMIDAI